MIIRYLLFVIRYVVVIGFSQLSLAHKFTPYWPP